MSRHGVVQGRFTADQQNVLTFKVTPANSMRRVRIGDAWFFCRPNDFSGDSEENRRCLRRLLRSQPEVRAAWVHAHGRRELVWLSGPEDLVLAPVNVVRQSIGGLVIGLSGLAAFVGAFWLLLTFLNDSGPMASAAGWWALPVLALFAIGTLGGMVAMMVGYAFAPAGFSAPRRRAHAAFFRPAPESLAQSAPAATLPSPAAAPGLHIDPVSGLAVYDGRIQQIMSREHATLHVTAATTTHLRHASSQHIAIAVDGEDTPVLLRTPTQDLLFLQPGDEVRIVGILHGGVLELLGLRNRTDGAGYVPIPASVLSRWGTHAVAGIVVVAGAAVLTMMGWHGNAGADDYLEVLGVLGALLAVYYAAVLGVYALGLRDRSVTEHAQPGDRADLQRTRELLGLPSRGEAVSL